MISITATRYGEAMTKRGLLAVSDYIVPETASINPDRRSSQGAFDGDTILIRTLTTGEIVLDPPRFALSLAEIYQAA